MPADARGASPDEAQAREIRVRSCRWVSIRPRFSSEPMRLSGPSPATVDPSGRRLSLADALARRVPGRPRRRRSRRVLWRPWSRPFPERRKEGTSVDGEFPKTVESWRRRRRWQISSITLDTPFSRSRARRETRFSSHLRFVTRSRPKPHLNNPLRLTSCSSSPPSPVCPWWTPSGRSRRGTQTRRRPASRAYATPRRRGRSTTPPRPWRPPAAPSF